MQKNDAYLSAIIRNPKKTGNDPEHFTLVPMAYVPVQWIAEITRTKCWLDTPNQRFKREVTIGPVLVSVNQTEI